jgi:hypothetical protein
VASFVAARGTGGLSARVPPACRRPPLIVLAPALTAPARRPRAPQPQATPKRASSARSCWIALACTLRWVPQGGSAAGARRPDPGPRGRPAAQLDRARRALPRARLLPALSQTHASRPIPPLAICPTPPQIGTVKEPELRVQIVAERSTFDEDPASERPAREAPGAAFSSCAAPPPALWPLERPRAAPVLIPALPPPAHAPQPSAASTRTARAR